MPFVQQIPREPILELLRRGNMTESAIAAQLGISRPTVHNIRVKAGLPAPLHGSRARYTSMDDDYRAHARPTNNGHMEWTGIVAHHGAPMVRHRRHTESAFRIAFRLHHQREPQGKAAPACGQPGCVAGAHIEDRPMRLARQQRERAARPKGPQPNGTRAEVIELLGQGLSNTQIAKILRTDPHRVGRIRAEEGLPDVLPPVLPLEEKWRTRTRPVGDGHLKWAGPHREGAPVLTWRGEHHMARRVAFRIASGREPEGRVKPGCDWAGCVAPAHMEDARLRAQYAAIFGEVAS